MNQTRWLVVMVTALFVGAGVGSAALAMQSSTSSSPAAAAAGVALPSSIAATGDSISQAFDADATHFLASAPAESWSTGSDPAINSQFRRIAVANPAVVVKPYNDSQTGAKMAALDGQMKAAASQGAQYVTVLMGANDLCTPTAAAMTPTAIFNAQFSQAMSDFFAADPGAHVFVASIPNIFQLWNTMHTNLVAEATWTLARICQSMLAPLNTAAQRQQVVDQELADNAVLASVCRSHPNCRWDHNAVFNVQFPASDVSTVDYFHPSLAGQKALAAVTWAAGYWPSSP
jgi:lysophospholipase L1-like esterase